MPGYLSLLPDTDLQFTTPYTTANPQLQYAINFTTPGTYTVWLRGYTPNAAGDSTYLGLNGQLVTPLTGFAPGRWSWAAKDSNTPSSVATIAITEPGLHTLNLWMREDGLRLDRIVLTTNASYNPNDNGPAESERKPFLN